MRPQSPFAPRPRVPTNGAVSSWTGITLQATQLCFATYSGGPKTSGRLSTTTSARCRVTPSRACGASLSSADRRRLGGLKQFLARGTGPTNEVPSVGSTLVALPLRKQQWRPDGPGSGLALRRTSLDPSVEPLRQDIVGYQGSDLLLPSKRREPANHLHLGRNRTEQLGKGLHVRRGLVVTPKRHLGI